MPNMNFKNKSKEIPRVLNCCSYRRKSRGQQEYNTVAYTCSQPEFSLDSLNPSKMYPLYRKACRCKPEGRRSDPLNFLNRYVYFVRQGEDACPLGKAIPERIVSVWVDTRYSGGM
jgi:hypothetical protein